MSYSGRGRLPILAMCNGRVEPLRLWTDFGLEKVKREVRNYWTEASTIHVMWHGLGEKSKLTDSNCTVMLELLEQRNSTDILIVSSEQEATKDSAEVPGREIIQESANNSE